MKFSRRVVATAFVAAGAMLASMPQALAGPPVSTFGCGPNYATLSSTGSFENRISVSENVTAAPYTDWIANHSGITTMASTVLTYLQNSDRQYYRALMVKGGYLNHVMTSYPNTDPSKRTTSIRQYGPGWGKMTRLVDASDRGTAVTKNGYLYALDSTTGTLARYSVVEGRNFGDLTIGSAGKATGYGNFKGLTLMYRYRAGYAGAADVLYGTTTAGALYQITIPNTSTYAPKLTLIRSSTWTFDQLAAVGCGNNIALLAIKTGTHHANLYRVDSFAGASSAIRGYGEVGTSWPAVQTTGFWGALSGPFRW